MVDHDSIDSQGRRATKPPARRRRYSIVLWGALVELLGSPATATLCGGAQGGSGEISRNS